MKLQLLITQYNEIEDVIRPMLTSIETQQGVDLKKDIEVIIANDGSDVKLSGDFLGSFSFFRKAYHLYLIDKLFESFNPAFFVKVAWQFGLKNPSGFPVVIIFTEQ